MIAKKKAKTLKNDKLLSKKRKKDDVRENPRIRMFFIVARYITLCRHIRKKIFFRHRTP